jgi:hypothetical protein
MATALDTALNAADGALRTLFAAPRASRTCPTVPGEKTELVAQDKARSGALMRVNHVGEVCAQAESTSCRPAVKRVTTSPGQKPGSMNSARGLPFSIHSGMPAPSAWAWLPAGSVTA